MTERSTSATVSFLHPAAIAGIDQVLPAGTYVVETDEEQIPGLSFVAYRRIQTMIIVPADASSNAGRKIVAIDPAALQAALDRDALQG